MVSCAVCSLYYSERERRQVIFLLDEPDACLPEKGKRELAAFLVHLSGSHQVLVCSAGSVFPPESRRQYRLQKGENGSTVVDFKE